MTQKPQIFHCVELKEISGKPCAEFASPDGQVFLVWESRYFKPKAGKKYTPVVAVIQTAYISKNNGRAYTKAVAVINWEELA